MGFALWIDGDLAWAQGTHEYRPMGVAVVSASDLFRLRDFRSRGRRRPVRDASFAGLFPSLEHVNRYMTTRRSQPNRRNRKTASKRLLAVL